MAVTDCWVASLILRDVIKTHTPWIAEPVACSVTVNDWELDEHCVVDCNGYPVRESSACFGGSGVWIFFLVGLGIFSSSGKKFHNRNSSVLIDCKPVSVLSG
jgi:hypothetical protein